MGGAEGIVLKQFLEQLAYELSIPSVDDIDTVRALPFDSCPLFSLGGLCSHFIDVFVPYLTPPNQKWPEYIQQKEFVLESMKRCKNKHRCDIKIGSLFRIECKDRTIVNSNEMKDEILKNAKSYINLVIANNFQNSYFNASYGWDTLLTTKGFKHLKGAICFALDVHTSEFIELKGLTDASLTSLTDSQTPEASRLILFLKIGDRNAVLYRLNAIQHIRFPFEGMMCHFSWRSLIVFFCCLQIAFRHSLLRLLLLMLLKIRMMMMLMMMMKKTMVCRLCDNPDEYDDDDDEMVMRCRVIAICLIVAMMIEILTIILILRSKRR